MYTYMYINVVHNIFFSTIKTIALLQEGLLKTEKRCNNEKSGKFVVSPKFKWL